MNLILTSTSGGLDAAAIEPFFHSLKLSNCQDEVIVFAHGISSECRSLLNRYQAKVIDFDYRGIPTLPSRKERFRRGSHALYNYYREHGWKEKDIRYLFFNNARFFFYHQYLQNVDAKPDRVLLADIRDVVFQASPFSFPFHPGLSVAFERTSRAIIQSWCAVKGMVEAVGTLDMVRLARRPVVCAGTTVADYETMMTYLSLMTERIRQRFFWALLEGIDQGLHTHFTHRQIISPLHCYTNWHGPFLTLDSEIVLPSNKNQEGYLCNQDGSLVPIVHQYDRIKHLYGPQDKRPACWKFYKNRMP
jgi:hypothetical protein